LGLWSAPVVVGGSIVWEGEPGGVESFGVGLFGGAGGVGELRGAVGEELELPALLRMQLVVVPSAQEQAVVDVGRAALFPEVDVMHITPVDGRGAARPAAAPVPEGDFLTIERQLAIGGGDAAHVDGMSE
jgi:hypothetical protein